MNLFFEAVGYLAGICLAISFLPQAIKTFRTKDVRSFSLGTYCIYNLGLLCWVVYGAYLHSYQMMIFNTLSLSVSLPILVMIIHYHKPQK